MHGEFHSSSKIRRSSQFRPDGLVSGGINIKLGTIRLVAPIVSADPRVDQDQFETAPEGRIGDPMWDSELQNSLCQVTDE